MEVYLVDTEGYLSDHFPAQENRKRPGQYLLPPDAILDAPEEREGYWPKYNRESQTWEYEKVPTTPADFLELPPISHQSQSPRDIHYRALIDKLKDADPSFTLKRGEEDLSWFMERVPEKTLEELRTEKLDKLRQEHLSAESNAHFVCSLGFDIDGNERAKRDIDGLVESMSDTDTKLFCDYNNEFHEVTRADCKTMSLDIIDNANWLYEQKWNLRQAIESATTKEELEAIEISFVYLQPYKAE